MGKCSIAAYPNQIILKNYSPGYMCAIGIVNKEGGSYRSTFSSCIRRTRLFGYMKEIPYKIRNWICVLVLLKHIIQFPYWYDVI